jgi:hypothetical protein
MLTLDPIGSLVLVEHFLPHQAVVPRGAKEAGGCRAGEVAQVVQRDPAAFPVSGRISPVGVHTSPERSRSCRSGRFPLGVPPGPRQMRNAESGMTSESIDAAVLLDASNPAGGGAREVREACPCPLEVG